MRRLTLYFSVVGVLLTSTVARAATLQPLNFVSTSCKLGTSNGTQALPWPGCLIQRAIAAATGGDTVVVPDGYWSVTTALSNTTGNFTLQGQSTNARIVFTRAGQWILGTQSSLTNNVKISGLTFDGSQSTSNASPVVIQNCVGCSVSGNTVLGVPNPSLAALQFFGGANTSINANAFMAGPSSGGAQLQLNALGTPSTPVPLNNGYEIAGNYFDSAGILIIGMSNIRIHDNSLVNTTLQNANGISFASAYNGTSRNISITNNSLIGTNNFVAISGVPEDAGGQGFIDGLNISGNVLDATQAFVAVNTYLTGCLSTCTTITRSSDVVVSNNFLKSAWGPSTIELAGGNGAYVQNVTVQGNILVGVGTNVIHTDANTLNMNKANNLGAP